MRALRIALLLLCIGIAPSAFAYSSPGSPTGYVNDFANVLQPEEKTALEAHLSAFNASSTNEITVVTVSTIGDDYIENYALKLFEEWGIGTKTNNNGVLLLVSSADRQLRIEVGYGLEGALPDSVADRIIRNDMVPLLREEKYGESIARGVDSIIAATQGEYAADESSMNFSMDSVMPYLVGAFFVLQWLLAIVARTKSWWFGGVIGLGIGVVASSLLGWWFLGGLFSTLGFILVGLLLDFLISRAYRESVAKGSTPPWWSGGSGGMGSGRGGGFGGFGGGRSGGGGASGRW